MAAIPNNIVFSVNSGVLTVSWQTISEADDDNVSMTIYRNGSAEETGYTQTEWYDSAWHENNYYKLEAVDGDGDTDATEWLIFPYYPVYAPDSLYYRDAWLLAAERLGQAPLASGNFQRQLKLAIRHEYELERINSGLLSDVGYTTAGPILTKHLVYDNLPLLHVQADRSPWTYNNSAEDELRHTFSAMVYGDGTDVHDTMAKMEDVLIRVAEITAREYAWGGACGAFDTVGIDILWPNPDRAIRENNVFALFGAVNFTVLARKAFEERY